MNNVLERIHSRGNGQHDGVRHVLSCRNESLNYNRYKRLDHDVLLGYDGCVQIFGHQLRLCIRALLSERHGGFGSSYVIIIDAGNSSDIYSSVSLARQYGLDLKDTLKRIVVSRPFTIYQLANLVTSELPKAVQKFDTKTIIISDMLRMFLQN